MKFKCKISDLETICKLVKAKGKNIDGKDYVAIPDVLINVLKPQTLSLKAMDIQGTFAVSIDYKIDEVSEEGQLPIGDIENFEQFLSRFVPTDEIFVSTTQNKIIIERMDPKKISRIPMGRLEDIWSRNAPPLDKLKRTDIGFDSGKLNYNLSMIVDAEKIKDIIEDGNVVKQRILPWRIDGNKLFISIGSETSGEFEVEVTFESGTFGKTSTAFGNGIDNIFANLSGKVKIFLPDNVEITPLIVEQVSDKFTYLAILAPYPNKE